MQDLSINSADILAQLNDEQLELFRKTALYRHHFNSELMVWHCDKSEITVEKGETDCIYIISYNILRYVGKLILKLVTSDTKLSTLLEYLVKSYIGSTLLCGEREISDIRYYKFQSDEFFITVYWDNNIIIRDYKYWLMQGNKPRVLSFDSNYTDLANNKDIIYLKIQCQYGNLCERITIPDNILFLTHNCDVDHDSTNFIAYGDGAMVQQAFYDYTFKRQSVKSSRN